MVVVAAAIGYWGVFSLSDSAVVVYEREGWDPEQVQLAEVAETSPIEGQVSPPETTTEPSVVVEAEEPEVSEYEELIGYLKDLKEKVIIVKRGDRGGNVKTIQEFINVYERKNASLDGDFGPGTETSIRSFQETEGIDVDGQVGPGTVETMIEWLEE
jgi:murein L,D-transpeptidase YcbB/YkuD